MGDKLERMLWLHYSQAARKMQRLFHFARARRAAIAIQKTARMWIVYFKFQRIRRFAIMNQALLRMYRCTFQFQQQRYAAGMIQRVHRGNIGRAIATTLKNPYKHLTYGEISTSMEALEGDLEESILTKNFKECERLYKAISQADTARSLLEAPFEQPTSRSDLELQILAQEFALEHFRARSQEEKGERGT